MWTSVTRIKLEYNFKIITFTYTLKTIGRKFPNQASIEAVTTLPLNHIVTLIIFLHYFILYFLHYDVLRFIRLPLLHGINTRIYRQN